MLVREPGLPENLDIILHIPSCVLMTQHVQNTKRRLSFHRQGVGSDLLVREPGLPENLDIIPHVPRIGVTSSRTAMHLVSALADAPANPLLRAPWNHWNVC